MKCPLIALIVLTTAVGGSLPARWAEGEEARPTADFLDSLGVCSHWGYPDTPYGFAYEKVRDLLVASGIRHVRDGMHPKMIEMARRGIRFTVMAEPDQGTPETIRDKIKAMNAQTPCIDAVEGTNEPDLFWPKFHKTYKDQGVPEGVIAFQKDLYRVLKADPKTAALSVYGPSLGVTYDPGGGKPNIFAKGSLTDSVDFGNFHPYPGGNPFSVPFSYAGIEKYYWQGNMPSGNLDEFPYALNTYAPPFAPRPMVSTETGYATNTGDGVAEDVHARYIPRLYAEYFRLGIARTFIYEFVDEFDRADDREARFGLVRRDLTPKPAYTALKSLIALLREGKPQPKLKPTPLGLLIKVQPVGAFDRTQFVHHLLLQSAPGLYDLLIWHEIADEDTSARPHKRINPPEMAAEITLPSSIQRANAYRYNDSWHLVPQKATLADGVLKLAVPDSVVVIRLDERKAADSGQ